MGKIVKSGVGNQPPELLIYVPCHTDYEMALHNIRKIQEQQKRISEAKGADYVKIKTTLSINGVTLGQNALEEIANEVDHFFYFKESIGADSNIAQGFMHALQNRPDYFWILSANEILKQNAIKNISQIIFSNETADLIVTNSFGRESKFQITDVFLSPPKGLKLGLISGVIYNFATTEFAFAAAAKFSWTGWGQLAVLQVACSRAGKLNVLEIPESNLYETPFTLTEGNSKENTSQTVYEVVRNNYQHSFFGMPILIGSLYSRNSKVRKRATAKWIRSHWYQVHYFSRGVDLNQNAPSPHFDTHWIRRISQSMLFNVSPYSSFLFRLGRMLPMEKLRKIKFLQRMRKK